MENSEEFGTEGDDVGISNSWQPLARSCCPISGLVWLMGDGSFPRETWKPMKQCTGCTDGVRGDSWWWESSWVSNGGDERVCGWKMVGIKAWPILGQDQRACRATTLEDKVPSSKRSPVLWS